MKTVLQQLANVMIPGRARNGRRPERRGGARLGVEGLETRQCLSCLFATGNNGHTLSIRGDGGDNVVSVVQNDSLDKLTVVGDGVTHVYKSSQITKVDLALYGGKDMVNYNLAPSPSLVAFSYEKELNVDTGAGDDTVDLEFWEGIPNPAVLGSNLKINLSTGDGNDSVNANLAGKRGGVMSFVADLGAGDDEAFVKQWGDIVGGAKVTFDVHGGLGNDSIGTWDTYDTVAQSYHSIDVSSTSSFTIKLSGDDGDDGIGGLYNGQVNGQVMILADGGAGNDNIDFSGVYGGGVYVQPGSVGFTQINVSGGTGDDVLALDVKNLSANAPLFANVDGGLGKDSAVVSAGVLVKNVP